MAPPNSTSDAGTGQSQEAARALFAVMIESISQSIRRGWRIAVMPRDQHGQPAGSTHLERLANEQAADARVQDIVVKIRGGSGPRSPAL